jgi:hypothetical protein
MCAVKWEFGEESLPQSGTCWRSEEGCDETTDVALDVALESAQEYLVEELDEEEPGILDSALKRAETFLRAQSYQMRRAFSHFAPLPRISPGPDGSVDLHWELMNGEMLVNIPAGQVHATYYAESGSRNRVKGSFDPSTWDLVVYTWLSKN